MQAKPWVVLALAGTLLGSGAAGASAVGTADAATPRLAAVEVVAQRTLMSAPAAPTVGLGFVAGGDLYDAAGTTKVGEGYSHCGVVSVSTDVPPAVTAHCTSVFQLPEGQLHLSGMRTYPSIATGFDDTAVAVIGGTAAYANARGDGTVTRSAPGETVGYRFIFQLADN